MGIETAIGLGGLVLGALGLNEQRRSARKVERATAASLEADRKTTAERVKRLEEENTRRQALAEARAAASGVSGASTSVYLDALEKSGIEEVAWLKEVGAASYEATKASGESAYSQAMAGFWGQAGNLAVKGMDVWSSIDTATKTA